MSIDDMYRCPTCGEWADRRKRHKCSCPPAQGGRSKRVIMLTVPECPVSPEDMLAWVRKKLCWYEGEPGSPSYRLGDSARLVNLDELRERMAKAMCKTAGTQDCPGECSSCVLADAEVHGELPRKLADAALAELTREG